MGLEQKEEPAAAWWVDHRLLVLWWGSFLKLLMLVVGGWCLRWWVELQWRHCSLGFQGLSLLSVSVWCQCRTTGTKWNLRCRIRGNEAVNLRLRGPLALYPPPFFIIIIYFCFVKVKMIMEIECKRFILIATRWNIRSLSYKSECCMRKTNGLCVMLGTTQAWTAAQTLFFLSWNLDQLHQLC